MIRAPRSASLVLAGALVLVAGCTTGSPEPPPSTSSASPTASAPPTAGLAEGGGLDRFYNQTLDWSDCDDDFQCASLVVPLDYEEPDGETLTVEINRRPATGSEALGSLIVNPGGPGGSGLDYARSPGVVSDQVLEAYDLVGFDPRGVGQSSPIDCLDDDELDVYLALDGSPDDEAELVALDQAAAEYAAACAERSGDVLPYVGTIDVARDLDVLRAVLGDESLQFLGKSYGTYIGAVYAEQFPDRVGRLVLDGALDPTISAVEVGLGQARGFERALRSFLEDCQEYLEECPFLDVSIDEAAAQVAALLTSIDASPLPTSGERDLPQALAILGVAVALYDSEFGWPLLRQALGEALDGSGDTLLLLSDVYTERQPDGSYASNSNESFTAVNCADTGDPGTIEDAQASYNRFVEASPVFGSYLAYSTLTCIHWPVDPTSEPRRITAAGAAPILVVGTTRDPATPYEWAEGLAEQLDSGVLLTLRGDGHTAYQQGNICIDETVDAYLLEGEQPVEGARC